MSEEEDKITLNNVENAVANPPNNEGDSDSQSDSLLINGNENTPPCQLDIGLGTHTDSRRHDNTLNVNDSGEATACSIKREDNLLSFRHFLCNNGHNQTSKPKVEVVPSVSQPLRPLTETSTLPDFVQDHMTTDQPYDNGDLDSRSNSIDLTRGINRPSMFGNRSNRTPQQCVVMPLDLPFTNTTTQPRATTPTTTNSLPDFLSDGPIGVPVVHPVTRNEQLTDRNRISITINPQRGATPINQNYTRFQRHSEVVDARVARLEATEQDLRTTILNLNNMLQQTLIRAQRAEDQVISLRTLLRAREQGLNPGNLSTIPSTISVAEQIRHGTRNAEIMLNLLRDNYQDLNNVAARLEQQDTVQTSNTQLSVDPSDTTDNNVT
ncbi:uncharacterized protein LOC100165265 isoform X1 [Acyrthosiphon pisum]|uniref:Uncharacterized protein n=1 Tax=Acyrthosiphon pisum TaxID=7029 RepID=A0A8R2A6G9_ACYPI|nr:uncharacterized protein LOC100165265 isoform X1 [Acyrthosiphon pisum]|eukprot:XP_001950604.2 PREDICTED: uncharacterized protein LOC100165265 isoform X1 [Acyrthosiphon pisum]